jgi:hypothetical protein
MSRTLRDPIAYGCIRAPELRLPPIPSVVNQGSGCSQGSRKKEECLFGDLRPIGFAGQRKLDEAANCLGPTRLIGLSLSPCVDCCCLCWQQSHHYWLGTHKGSSATAPFSNINYY